MRVMIRYVPVFQSVASSSRVMCTRGPLIANLMSHTLLRATRSKGRDAEPRS